MKLKNMNQATEDTEGTEVGAVRFSIFSMISVAFPQSGIQGTQSASVAKKGFE